MTECDSAGLRFELRIPQKFHLDAARGIQIHFIIDGVENFLEMHEKQVKRRGRYTQRRNNECLHITVTNHFIPRRWNFTPDQNRKLKNFSNTRVDQCSIFFTQCH